MSARRDSTSDDSQCASPGVVHKIAAIGRREILMQVIHPTLGRVPPIETQTRGKAELHAQTAHIQQVVFPVIARNPVLVFATPTVPCKSR